MIITVRSQAKSEERSHFMTQVCRITGSRRPITTIVMDGHELLILDGTQLDRGANGDPNAGIKFSCATK